MSLPNTQLSLTKDIASLNLSACRIVMVHSSLKQLGYTTGGAATVVASLLESLQPQGTLVMPAETPGISDPAQWNDARVKPQWHTTIRAHLPVFDPRTTPTTMGAIAEAFRTFPGTKRSDHPQVSVCANGPQADVIVNDHPLEFSEGEGTPFEKLYTLDAWTLLLGVGFNRCTSLHYAESLTAGRRTTVNRYPIIKQGQRVWVESKDMASDNGLHFPIIGERFIKTGGVRQLKIGEADALFFSTRRLVEFARDYFEQAFS